MFLINIVISLTIMMIEAEVEVMAVAVVAKMEPDAHFLIPLFHLKQAWLTNG